MGPVVSLGFRGEDSPMTDAALTTEPTTLPIRPAWQEFAQAPLVPVALAATLGLLVDRYIGLPLAGGLALTVGSLVGWAVASWRGNDVAGIWIVTAFVGLAATYHHTHRHSFPANDIGNMAATEPQLVQLRGIVLEEPIRRTTLRVDPLSPPQKDRDSTRIRVTSVAGRPGEWLPTTGTVTLMVDREPSTHDAPTLGGIHAGDAVEIVGMLARPRSPGNPGEQDYAAYLLDQRIRAELRVSDSAATVTRLEVSVDTWSSAIATARGWAAEGLSARLPPRSAAVARALLLGDTAAMDREEWDGYVRTGVVHALAISGQHLLVLAGFAWVVLKIAGVRRARGAWIVMLLIVGYAVLTGLRPSGVRAAIMVTAVSVESSSDPPPHALCRGTPSCGSLWLLQWSLQAPRRHTHRQQGNCQLRHRREQHTSCHRLRPRCGSSQRGTPERTARGRDPAH